MFISERIVPSGVRLSRSRTLVVRPAVVCAVLWLASVVCSAHEIGTTRVAIWIEADRYRAEIVTDAQALSEKLAAASGQQRGETLDADQLQQRLAGFKDLLLSRVTLQFDGARVQPAVEYSVTSSSSQTAPSVRIQLTGAIPVDAAAFDWTYGWTYASYALTIHRGDAPPTTEWLEGGQPSAAVALAVPAPAASRSHTAGRYLLLGFTHIIPLGLDHILFVLGIFLLTRRLRPMLLQVTAFTVAHSITLGLGIFGLLSAAPSVVEPLIALSIAYVAFENLIVRELKPWRVGLIFAFGLLHGLGFAGALREVGLPRSEFLTALVAFNLGVEAGQLAVIAAAFLLVGFWFGDRPWYRQRLVVPASAFIACVGVFWTFERLAL